MSRSELIEMVDRTSPEDRLPGHGRELDRRLDAMRAGDEVSLEEARKLHEALAARGL